MKCKYSHCKHETTEIPNGEEVLVGKSSYYHKDCYEEMSTIKNIIDVFVKKVDEHPIMSLLRKVVNDIVYNHKVDAKYLLFALNYCVDNNLPIRHPQGLYYIVKNNAINQQWQHVLASQNRKEIKERLKNVEINSEEEDKSFEYHVQKAVGFEDILR